MFDIAWSELFIVGVVALLVVGPKELPVLLRTIGRYVGMVRRQADEFKAQFAEAMRETEMDEIRKDVAAIKSDAEGVLRDAAHGAETADAKSANKDPASKDQVRSDAEEFDDPFFDEAAGDEAELTSDNTNEAHVNGAKRDQPSKGNANETGTAETAGEATSTADAVSDDIPEPIERQPKVVS